MASEGAIELEGPRRLAGTPWWERNLPWLLIAPTLLFLIVFSIIPALTTIRQPRSEIGEAAFATLLARIDGEKGSDGPTLLPAQLIVRESTRAA